MALFGPRAQTTTTHQPAIATVVAEPVAAAVVEAVVETPSPTPSRNTGLEKAHERMAALRASGELKAPERVDPIEKARRNPKSLRCAITAMCFDCVGAGADPNPRQTVRDCSVTSCPLWHQRPWQHVAGKSMDEMTEAEVEAAHDNPATEDYSDDESEVPDAIAA